jgi:hypothetical protein
MTWSANKRKLHLARPSGGLLQAIAVIFAMDLPLNLGGCPERAPSLMAHANPSWQ